ncbi:hypothetical protein KXD40_002252 [Peronospora effusa]|nr:hypothetical protein KXD40_002252 [Peronospora effusa]
MADVPVTAAAPSCSPLIATDLEREHVHKVYDLIAPHFSHTRHHPWPQVTEFLDKLASDALVADVGCGNGKYLRANPSLCMIGADRSIPLMHAGAPIDSPIHCGIASCLDGGTSGCTRQVEFLATVWGYQKRLTLTSFLSSELARLVRVGGQVLIVAWAFEQDENSKRRFEQQDVMVEWKLQQKYAKDDEDIDTESHGQIDREKRWVVYERYCHVYRRGELESLVDQVPGLELVSVEYIRSN